MIDPISSSKEVFEMASEQIEPWAKVLMFSGGKDSMATLELCRVLDVRLDAICFVDTGTGIPETIEFVRSFAEQQDCRFLEFDSDNAYEKYVRNRGFFGIGTGYNSAHSMAFHVCKRDAYTKGFADFRERKRGRKIWLINGARVAESANRDANMAGRYIKSDRYKDSKPASPNWWVSPLLDWSNADRDTFLSEQKCAINPVSRALCRSGECMCGTTQGLAARVEAEAFSPRWKDWITPLDEYAKRSFGFGWGQPFNQYRALELKGQLKLNLFDDSPMCSSCRKDATTEMSVKPTCFSRGS